MQDVRILPVQASGDWIEANLLDELRSTVEQGVNDTFSLFASNTGGERLGGVTASTSYGWLLIKVLWVEPAHRRQGIGRTLVEQTLSRARKFGCHSVWLDTSNRQAMMFYKSLGFQTFGRLANGRDLEPANHVRWFLRREL